MEPASLGREIPEPFINRRTRVVEDKTKLRGPRNLGNHPIKFDSDRFEVEKNEHVIRWTEERTRLAHGAFLHITIYARTLYRPLMFVLISVHRSTYTLSLIIETI